jgi:hypothetical protein
MTRRGLEAIIVWQSFWKKGRAAVERRLQWIGDPD